MLFTLRTSIVAILAGGLIILAVVGYASRRTIRDLTEANMMVTQTYDVLGRVQALMVAAAELQRSSRGYVIAGDEHFLGDYEANRRTLTTSASALEALLNDRPRQQHRVHTLGQLLQRQLDIQASVVETRRRLGLQASLAAVQSGEGERVMQEIRTLVEAIVADEAGLLQQRRVTSTARSDTALAIITAGFAIALVFALGSAVVVGREVVRRERAQAEVAERNRELNEAYIELDRTRQEQIAAKDQVLSHVSHELRTPLNAIYQFVTILQDRIAGDLTVEQEEYLGIVRRNVTQLQSMIADVLEATRAQAGKVALTFGTVDVEATARDLVRVMRSRASEKNLSLNVRGNGLSPSAVADQARVRQVLTNLIDNAIKFTPAGGTVTVEVAPHTDDAYVRASVHDSGPGLPPQAVARVFDRLYQAGDRVEETSRKGLGLGLYICRELVNAMGGRIWVESTAGAGATFSFILPTHESNTDRRG